jgi:hypothetical protein
MGLYILSIEKGSAWEVMNSLGKLTCLHFIDSNTKEHAYRLHYASIVYRCDEGLRRIKYIEQLCEHYGKRIRQPPSVSSFLESVEKASAAENMNAAAYFEKVELIIEKTEEFLRHQQTEAERAFSKYSFVVEQRYVIEQAGKIMVDEKK